MAHRTGPAGRCGTVPAMAVPTDADRRTLRALALTNYGHFTTMLVTDHRVRGLELHLRRLVRDCRALFDTDLDPDAVRARIRDAVPAGDAAVARVTVADPALDLGTVGGPADPHVLVTTRPAPATAPPPLRVRTVAHRRNLPGIKSVDLFAAMHLRRSARRDGVDDVLFTGDGMLLEGSTWNVGLVAGDRVVWPAGPALAGTGRALLRTALGGTVLDDTDTFGERVPVAELDRFDAAFATNATTGVRAISAIDGHRFPEAHPLVTRLGELHAAVPGTPLQPARHPGRPSPS